MKAQIVKYTEAIAVALVVAAVLGGWARSALDRQTATACVPQLMAGGSEISFSNLRCPHAAEMRAPNRPISVGHVQAGNSQAISASRGAGAEVAATNGPPGDDPD